MSQQEQEKKKTAKRIHAPKGPAAIERTKRRKQIRFETRTEQLAKLRLAKAGLEKPSNLYKDRAPGFGETKLQGKYMEFANLLELSKTGDIVLGGPDEERIRGAFDVTAKVMEERAIPFPSQEG